MGGEMKNAMRKEYGALMDGLCIMDAFLKADRVKRKLLTKYESNTVQVNYYKDNSLKIRPNTTGSLRVLRKDQENTRNCPKQPKVALSEPLPQSEETQPNCDKDFSEICQGSNDEVDGQDTDDEACSKSDDKSWKIQKSCPTALTAFIRQKHSVASTLRKHGRCPKKDNTARQDIRCIVPGGPMSVKFTKRIKNSWVGLTSRTSRKCHQNGQPPNFSDLISVNELYLPEVNLQNSAVQVPEPDAIESHRVSCQKKRACHYLALSKQLKKVPKSTKEELKTDLLGRDIRNLPSSGSPQSLSKELHSLPSSSTSNPKRVSALKPAFRRPRSQIHEVKGAWAGGRLAATSTCGKGKLCMEFPVKVNEQTGDNAALEAVSSSNVPGKEGSSCRQPKGNPEGLTSLLRIIPAGYNLPSSVDGATPKKRLENYLKLGDDRRIYVTFCRSLGP